MCGILGQINYVKDIDIDDKVFKRSLDLQYHRGPNDSDIYKSKKYIFGHRRLSIIDLDHHAKQPMISDCGNYVLVFNGEIYNYKEIKKDLVKVGYKFRTNSDTEVLLNSFIEYGINCIHKFIGMFAFTIHDNRTNEYYIVRDRLGIKPLYYSSDSERMIFSSEIKSILEIENKKKVLDITAVSSYLSFRYPILDNTFFSDIHSLPPAHYIKLTDSNIEIIEYWNVIDKFKEQQTDKGESFYKDKLYELLESAVKYRMISDVPFGAFLSGGVDSSVITALMANNSKHPIKTFTIGFEEENYNEFSYANMIVARYHTDHKEIILSGENYIQAMEDLICFKDAPLSVPNEVPLYLMSKELKKYITVVLSGEGADEIFGGYGRICRSPYDYERMNTLDSLSLTSEENAEFIRNFKEKYLTDKFDNEIDHFMSIYSYTSYKDKVDLLNPSLPLDTIEEKFVKKFLSFFDELKDDSYYNKLMYSLEKVHLVGLLNRVDTTTMATSVEARVPFVDHRLVEFAFTVPLKYKLKWANEKSINTSKLLMSDKISEVHDTPKYILKAAFEDLIPPEVLYRKKMGFPVPLNIWFGGQLKKYAKEILLSDEAKARGLYNIENIEQWLNNDNLSSDHGFAMKIWMLINLELFVKKYFT